MNLQKIRYTNYAGELNGSPQSECSGYDNWRKFNDKGEISEENTSANPIDLTLTTPKDGGEYIGFDWSSQQGIAKINVKAGDDDSNVYEFDVPYPTAGSGSTNSNCVECQEGIPKNLTRTPPSRLIFYHDIHNCYYFAHTSCNSNLERFPFSNQSLIELLNHRIMFACG